MTDTIRKVKAKMLRWDTWAQGLMGAFIGGAANAVTVMVVDPVAFNLGDGWKKLATVTFLMALVSAALYLKQHPVPDAETTIIERKKG